jgi:hypothetical protein
MFFLFTLNFEKFQIFVNFQNDKHYFLIFFRFSVKFLGKETNYLKNIYSFRKYRKNAKNLGY